LALSLSTRLRALVDAEQDSRSSWQVFKNLPHKIEQIQSIYFAHSHGQAPAIVFIFLVGLHKGAGRTKLAPWGAAGMECGKPAGVRSSESSQHSIMGFVERLEENIRQDRLPTCLRRSRRQLCIRLVIRNEKLRQALRWFHIVLLKFLTALHCVDLRNRHDLDRLCFHDKLARFFKTSFVDRTLPGKCLFLFMFFQVVQNMRIFTILYYQYAYDFNKLRLERLTDVGPPGGASHPCNRSQLELNAKQARRVLKTIGAPHLEWSILVECMYGFSVTASLFCMLAIPFYLNFARAPYFPWARYFLDPVGEVRAQAELIAELVDSFIRWSRNYTIARLDCQATDGDDGRAEWDRHQSGDSSGPTTTAGWPRMAGAHSGSQLLVSKHTASCRLALSIALGGGLNPPVDRSCAWLDLLALVNVCLPGFMLVYGAVWAISLYAKVERYFGRAGKLTELDSYKDYLTLVCLGLDELYLIMSVCLLFQLAVPSIMDTLRTLKLFKALLLLTIKQNELNIEQLLGVLERMRPHQLSQLMLSRRLRAPSWDRVPRTTAPSVHLSHGCDRRQRHHSDWKRPLFAKMESIETNFMTAILHFNHCQHELVRNKSSFQAMAMACIMVSGALPVIVRLHIPYLRDSLARRFMASLSISSLAPMAVFLWPPCYIHSRSLEIYRLLTYLRTQMTRLEASRLVRDCLNIDQQLSLLRKELERPEQFAQQTAIRLMGPISLTYPSVIRIQFYISLVMVSMLVDLNTMGGSVTNGFLADPFGVLKY
jgi:hypothetical protein